MPVQQVTPLKLKAPYQNNYNSEIEQDGVKRSYFSIELFRINQANIINDLIYNTSFDLTVNFKTKAAETRDITQTIGSSRMYFGTTGINATSEFTYRVEETWFKDKRFLVDLPLMRTMSNLELAPSAYNGQVSFEVPFASDLYTSVMSAQEGENNPDINIPMVLSLDFNLKTKVEGFCIVEIYFYYYAGMTNEFSFEVSNFITDLPTGSVIKNTNLEIEHYIGDGGNT